MKVRLGLAAQIYLILILQLHFSHQNINIKRFKMLRTFLGIQSVSNIPKRL